MVAPPDQTPSAAARPRRRASVLPYLLLLLWLEAGYVATLTAIIGMPWARAAWQAALCVAAIAPLLLLVVFLISLPKGFRRHLARPLLGLFWVVGNIGQLVVPWLGWSALLHALNTPQLSAGDALIAGGAVAWFSYLTGVAVILLLHPGARDVVVTRLDLALPALPAAFEGYRILHISDLHAGPFLSTASLQARLAAARSVQADLLAFTGDLATAGPDRAAEAAALLGQMTAADGAAAVLGNHDHWMGEEVARAALSAEGVRVLVNEHIVLRRGDQSLYLAGVDDASYTRKDDPAKAMAGIPEGAAVILLSHAPDVILRPESARADLILAGHTHGGQIALPRIGPLYVPSRLGRRYASGLYQLDGGWLFVNRGLGEVFPPLRVDCPPEVALITLRRGRPSN